MSGALIHLSREDRPQNRTKKPPDLTSGCRSPLRQAEASSSPRHKERKPDLEAAGEEGSKGRKTDAALGNRENIFRTKQSKPTAHGTAHLQPPPRIGRGTGGGRARVGDTEKWMFGLEFGASTSQPRPRKDRI